MTAINWKTGSTDVWSDASAWSTGAVPGAGDDVTISVAPATAGVPYTVEIESAVAVHSIMLDQAEAELQVIATTLSVTSTFALTAGTLDLDDGSTLQGGTYSSSTGTVLVDGYNYANNVTWDGTLNLSLGSTAYGTLSLNTLTLHGTNGSGVGTLSIGNKVSVYYGYAATLANAAILLGNGSEIIVGDTLTIASTSSVTEAGTATLGGYTGSTYYSLTNQGKITASGAGNTMFVTTGAFTNTGTITASSGGTVVIDSTTGSNSGLLSVSAGSFLELETTGGAGFKTTGSISVTGTLALDYALTTAQLDAYSAPSGTIAIAGTLTNTTLATGSTLGALQLDGGTIYGGTVINSGHFSFATSNTSSYTGVGTLSSVTFDGAINLTALYDYITVQGSLTLAGSSGTGAGTLAITGNDAGIDFSTTQVLKNAVIKLGSTASTLSSAYAFLDAGTYSESTATTLVLGSSTTLTQAGALASLQTTTAQDAILNQGSITAAVSGGTLEIGNFTNAGSLSDTGEDLFVSGGKLTNNGTLSLSGSLATLGTGFGPTTVVNSGLFTVSNGATFTLGGNVSLTNTGTLALSAATLVLDASASTATLGTTKFSNGSTVSVYGTFANTGTLSLGKGAAIATLSLESGGLITGGTFVDAGGGLVPLGGTLSGVTYKGELSLTGTQSQLTIADGLTVEVSNGAGAGTIAVTGPGADLYFAGSQTLNKAVVNLGSPPISQNEYYTNFLTAGSYSETAATTLTLGTSFQLNQVGAFVDLQGEYTDDAIINEGTITAAYAGGALRVADFINDGTILISNNDQIYGLASNGGTIRVTSGELRIAGTFANAGLLSLSGTAATIGTLDYEEAYSIDNTGTLSISSGAVIDLGYGAGSFSNSGVLNVSDATAVLVGTLSAASLGTINLTDGGALILQGTLTNSGTLSIGSGTSLPELTLDFGGTISGGAIADAGGGLLLAGGTLSGVTYQGALTLSSLDASLAIASGLTLDPFTGTGTGSLVLSGAGASLDLVGSQTIGNALVTLAGNALNPPPSIDIQDQESSGASTITFAAGSTLLQTGLGYLQGTYAYNSGTGTDSPTGDTLVNAGTLSFAETNGNLSVSYLIVQNSGALNVTNGESLSINDGTLTNSGKISLAGSYTSLYFVTYDGNNDAFANTGLVTIGATDTLSLDGSSNSGTPYGGTLAWSNTGTIDVAGGTLDAGGTFTTAQLGDVAVSNGGSVQFQPDAYLNNTGATLTVGTGTSIGTIDLFGTIHGGTIADAGGGIAFNPYFTGFNSSIYGTLDAVTYRGTLTVSAYDTATITGGITLKASSGNNAGAIALINSGSVLDFATSESLNTATLYVGASGNGNTLSAASSSATNTLTLGTSLLLKQTGADFTLGGANGTIRNTGSLGFADAGGTITLAGTFTNSGTIAVSNGETLVLATSSLQNTGTISVTDGLLAVGNATSAQLAAISLTDSDLAVTGQLTATGATLTVGAGTSIPTLKLQGTIFGGTIHDAGGGVQFEGFSTLDNVTYQGTMVINRPQSYLIVQGSFAATSLAGSLAGSISLTGAGSGLVWDSTQALNNATISIGNPGLSYEGNVISAPALVSDFYGGPVNLGTSLVVQQSGIYADIGGDSNYGYISLGGGVIQSAATIEAAIAGGNFTLEGDSFVTTGTIAISNGDTVTAGAATTTNAGLITVGAGSALNLNLYNYFNDASLSDESFINTGSITLAGGSLVELTDGGTFPSVAMLNASGGRFKGFGTVAAPVVNNGVLEAAGGTLALTGAVTGTGVLEVLGTAVLDVTSVSTGQTVTFNGTGGLLGLAPPSFLGVISGFAVGDSIDLASTAAKSASFSGDSIVVTLTAGGTLALATTSALTGTLTVTAGTHNDTLLKYSSASTKSPKSRMLADFAAHLPASQADPNAASAAGLRSETYDPAVHWMPMLHG